MEPEVLVERTGPNGNVMGLVEDDGRVVYLYLRCPDADWMKCVWVQNRIAAPDETDVAAMKEGLPPLMPSAHCRHPRGTPPLEGELSLCWLPEGNGVALTDQEGLLAAVMPWSGQRGFYGYSRHALGEGPFAWSLDGAPAVFDRFAAAKAYWKEWEVEPNPWQRIQAAQMAAYEAALGKHSRYFAIDGDEWPQRGLIRTDRPDGIFLATIGVALRPQPQVELDDEHPEHLRRIELAMALPPATPGPVVDAWCSYIAGQASLPWARYTWLGPGHTIPSDVAQARGFPAVVLARGDALTLPARLPDFAGDPVNVLWLTPITADERARAQREGSKAIMAGLRGAHRTRA
jgi:hypothetical protein